MEVLRDNRKPRVRQLSCTFHPQLRQLGDGGGREERRRREGSLPGKSGFEVTWSQAARASPTWGCPRGDRPWKVTVASICRTAHYAHRVSRACCWLPVRSSLARRSEQRARFEKVKFRTRLRAQRMVHSPRTERKD